MSAQPQHMQALELARSVRSKQVAALNEVRAGESIRTVLFSEDTELGSITLGKLLRAKRRWGGYKTATLCRRLAVNELTPIRKLTARQKDLLASEVEG